MQLQAVGDGLEDAGEGVWVDAASATSSDCDAPCSASANERCAVLAALEEERVGRMRGSARVHGELREEVHEAGDIARYGG